MEMKNDANPTKINQHAFAIRSSSSYYALLLEQTNSSQGDGMVEREITLSKKGLTVGKQTIPFVSGSCHYWRIDRSKWSLILGNFADLGFPVLQTYVPWCVHETSPGQFDFGEFSPNKNLPAFLELCKENELFVLLRPGPHINAEITYFGYPKRLFENPENLSVSATGGQVLLPALPRTFPAISYASEHFFKELAIYYDAFAKIALPYCYPNGPVVGIQADNEMSFFFRTAAFDHDYSHWAYDMYIRWLKEKYDGLDEVRRIYRMDIASFADLKMPTSFRAKDAEDLIFYIDWCEFKEELLHRPLNRMLDMLKERGFDRLLTFHNYPLNLLHTPFNISRGEKIFDFVGVDYYNKKTDFKLLRKRFLALAGTSRFPVSPEFSSGCYQAWVPIDLSDQKFTTLLAIAYGLRGFNFYMIVERERWYGSPIKQNGEYRVQYAEFYKSLNHFFTESNVLSMDRETSVILLRVRDYDRLEKAADLLSPLPPLATEGFLGAKERCYEDKFGFDYAVQIEHAQLFDTWYEGLCRAQISFAVSDSDIDPNLLAKHDVIILPSFDFMSRRLQLLLQNLVESGKTIIMGPTIPTQDETMVEYSTLDQYVSRPVHKLDCMPDTLTFNAGSGRIVLMNGTFTQEDEQTDRLIQEVCNHIHIRPFFPTTPPCQTSMFTSPEGKRIVFLINPSNSSKRPRVKTEGSIKFRDFMTNEEFFGGQFIMVDMDPYSIRPLEVLPC